MATHYQIGNLAGETFSGPVCGKPVSEVTVLPFAVTCKKCRATAIFKRHLKITFQHIDRCKDPNCEPCKELKKIPDWEKQRVEDK